MPKVSVIVPVYGVEKYIERCARSLFEQTLDDIEYLFIDDCTPDRSIEILQQVLEEYPQRKPQVVIHQMEKNSGQAAVRKWGMQNATGEYVIHCDSDDWVDTDMYRAMYEKAKEEEADLVYCDYKEEGGSEGRIVRKPLHNGIHNKEVISMMLRHILGLNPLWSVLVKNSLLSNDFVYPVNNQSEDWAIMIQLLYYAKKIVYTDQVYYHYYINPVSIMHAPGREKILSRVKDVLMNNQIVIEFLHSKNIADYYKKEIEFSKLQTRWFIRGLSKEKDYKKLWNEIFPEINKSMWFNKYIDVKMKLYNLLVQILY